MIGFTGLPMTFLFVIFGPFRGIAEHVDIPVTAWVIQLWAAVESTEEDLLEP